MISEENHQEVGEKDLRRKEKKVAVTKERVAQEEVVEKGLIDTANVDSTIFGTGKFYKEQEEKKENIERKRLIKH